MQGTLLVNHALAGEKYRSQTELYLKAAVRLGISLTVQTNADGLPPKRDFILFLDKDVRLARLLEQNGHRLFNSALSVALCDDKSLTYLQLRQKGIPMPETLLVPLTFFPTDWSENPFVGRAAGQIGFPMIAKECFGSFGKQVWLLESREELIDRLNRSADKGMLLQEFISSSRGHDIRIQVVGDRAVACMYRYSDTDFRANLSSGGKMKPYTPDRAQTELAVRACRELGLSFGGVDLLFGKDGEPILCEVNSNAHIRNIFDCTGVQVAEEILRHIVSCLKKSET